MDPYTQLRTRLVAEISAVCPCSVKLAIDGRSATFEPYPEASPEQITAAQEALAAFDWDVEAQREWETNQSIAAGLAGLMVDASPTACGLRFYLRILTDRVNTLARLAGVPPILETDLPGLAAEYGFLAAPGPRSDVG
jgi:hypothetical protein